MKIVLEETLYFAIIYKTRWHNIASVSLSQIQQKMLQICIVWCEQIQLVIWGSLYFFSQIPLPWWCLHNIVRRKVQLRESLTSRPLIFTHTHTCNHHIQTCSPTDRPIDMTISCNRTGYFSPLVRIHTETDWQHKQCAALPEAKL